MMGSVAAKRPSVADERDEKVKASSGKKQKKESSQQWQQPAHSNALPRASSAPSSTWTQAASMPKLSASNPFGQYSYSSQPYQQHRAPPQVDHIQSPSTQYHLYQQHQKQQQPVQNGYQPSTTHATPDKPVSSNVDGTSLSSIKQPPGASTSESGGLSTSVSGHDGVPLSGGHDGVPLAGTGNDTPHGASSKLNRRVIRGKRPGDNIADSTPSHGASIPGRGGSTPRRGASTPSRGASTPSRGAAAQFLVPSHITSSEIQLASLAVDGLKVMTAYNVIHIRNLKEEETHKIYEIMDEIDEGAFALSNGNQSELLFQNEGTDVIRVFKIKIHMQDGRIELLSHHGLLLANVLVDQKRVLIYEFNQAMKERMNDTDKPLCPISFLDLMYRIRSLYCIQGYTTTNKQRNSELKPIWQAVYDDQKALIHYAPRLVMEGRIREEKLLNTLADRTKVDLARTNVDLEEQRTFQEQQRTLQEQQRTLQLALSGGARSSLSGPDSTTLDSAAGSFSSPGTSTRAIFSTPTKTINNGSGHSGSASSGFWGFGQQEHQQSSSVGVAFSGGAATPGPHPHHNATFGLSSPASTSFGGFSQRQQSSSLGEASFGGATAPGSNTSTGAGLVGPSTCFGGFVQQQQQQQHPFGGLPTNGGATVFCGVNGGIVYQQPLTQNSSSSTTTAGGAAGFFFGGVNGIMHGPSPAPPTENSNNKTNNNFTIDESAMEEH